MYSTYEQYTDRGGKLSESDYQAAGIKASEMIDYHTMGMAAVSETMQPQLSACECDLIDMIRFIETVSSGIKAENNDGFSQTFSGTKEMKINVLGILKRHLTFPDNLLSISGKSFV